MKDYGIKIPQVGFKLDEIGGVQRPPNLSQWATALQQYLNAESTSTGGVTQTTSNVSMNFQRAQQMQNYVTTVDGANGPITVYLDPATNTITQIPDELGNLQSYQQLIAANPSVANSAVPAMLERAGVEVPGHNTEIDPIIGRYQQALDNQASEQPEELTEPTSSVPQPDEAPQDIAAQDTAETEQTIAEDPVPAEPAYEPPAEEVAPQVTEPAPQETTPEPVEATPDTPGIPEPEMPDIEPPIPTDIPPVDVPEVATDITSEPTAEVPAEDVPVPAEDVSTESVPTDNIEVPDATDMPDDPSVPEIDIPNPTEDTEVATGDPVTDIASIVLKTLAAAAVTYGGIAIANRIRRQGDWNQANIVQGEQAGPTLGAMMTPVIRGLYQAKDPKERNRLLKGSLKQAKVAYQVGNSKWIPLRSWEDLSNAAMAIQNGEVTAVARQ